MGDPWYRRVVVCAGLAVALQAGQPVCATDPQYQGKPAAKWIDLLTSQDDAERDSAARAIAADPKNARPVLDELVGQLGDRDILRRLIRRSALAAAGPAAVPSLLDGLRNPNAVVRRTSFSALQYSGIPQSELATSLLRLLPELDAEIEQKVLDAVRRIGTAATPAWIEASRYRGPKAAHIHDVAIDFLSRMELDNATVVQALVECLRDESSVTRRRAAQLLLSAMSTEAAVVAPALRNVAINDPNSMVRAAARHSLGYSVVRSGSQPLPVSLNEIQLLRVLGDLHDSNPATIRQAVFEAASLGPAANEAKPALAALLSHSDFDMRSITAAALALVSGSSDSLAVIEDGVNENKVLKTEVIELLVKCGVESVPILLEANQHENDENGHKHLADAVGRIPIRPEDTGTLRSLLEHKAPFVRAWAAKKLLDLRDPTAATIGAWARRMTDPDQTIRERAALAMMDLGQPAVGALTDVARDKNPLVRRKAVFVITVIGKPSSIAVDALVRALEDDDDQVRFWACVALGRVRDQQLRLAPLMSARQTDASERVRGAARNAFLQLTLTEAAQ
jgi:HEAT repeat protein